MPLVRLSMLVFTPYYGLISGKAITYGKKELPAVTPTYLRISVRQRRVFQFIVLRFAWFSIIPTRTWHGISKRAFESFTIL